MVIIVVILLNDIGIHFLLLPIVHQQIVQPAARYKQGRTLMGLVWQNTP
jgi:hypothetical protein